MHKTTRLLVKGICIGTLAASGWVHAQIQSGGARKVAGPATTAEGVALGVPIALPGSAATSTGLEAEIDWKLKEELTLTLMSDYVRAENTADDEPIPRMPPLRFGGRLEWSTDRFTAGIEVRHATSQDRVKPAPRPELPSGSYTMVNADASWTLPVKSQELTFFLRATNLLNEEARVSTSFRKDVAPLPGRGLMVGVRHEF